MNKEKFKDILSWVFMAATSGLGYRLLYELNTLGESNTKMLVTMLLTGFLAIWVRQK